MVSHLCEFFYVLQDHFSLQMICNKFHSEMYFLQYDFFNVSQDDFLEQMISYKSHTEMETLQYEFFHG